MDRLPFRFGARTLLALAFLAGVAPTAPTARAEEEDPDAPAAPLMVRDTNAAKFAHDAARRAVAAKDATRTTREIQSLLGPLADDVVLVSEPGDPYQSRWVSAPEAARSVLEALSPDLRRAYEQVAEAAARPLLLEAAPLRDERALRALLLRYPATPSASAAARLLAESALEAGRPRDAAWAAAEGLRFAPGDAGLWLLRVDALSAAGDGEALAALSAPRDPLPPVTAGGVETTVAARLLAARARPARAAPPPEGWPLWGGNAAHDRVFDADAVLRPLRWSEGTVLGRRDKDEGIGYGGNSFFPDRSDDRFDVLWESWAPLFPALSKRVLHVADGRSVSAYDLYSGRLRWRFPGPHGDGGAGVALGRARGRTNLALAHAPAVSGGRVLANVEVDRPYHPRHLSTVEYTTFIPRRVLVALDEETGRPLWRMGEAPEDALRLGDASVAGPPVVAEGLVVVPVVRYGGGSRVWIVAFHEATGRVAWDRHLVTSNQELNLFGEPVKEIFAGAAAVADGVVYAGTGLGIVAALDLRTGVVRWMSTYDTIHIERVEHWYTTPLRFPLWGPSPPVVRGRAFVTAPPDARHLCAFDRATGRLLWREPSQAREGFGRAVDHLLGVVAVSGRDAVLTAGTDVRAHDLANGRVVSSAPLAGSVVGRGALSKTTVAVSTTEGVERFSLEPSLGLWPRLRPTGVDAWRPDAHPGNLLAFPGVLVVAGRGRSEEDGVFAPQPPVQVFFAWEEIERDLGRRRSAAPDDPAVLLELADVLRVAGEWTRARAVYDEAARVALGKRHAALAERARQGVHRVHLDRGDQALRDGRASAARPSYEAALESATRPEERVAARARLDRVHAASGDEPARIANLEAVAAEGAGVVAPVGAFEEPLPVRAWARLEAARLHHEAGRLAKAVDEYQALLQEDPQALLPEGTAKDVGRAAIDRLLREGGRGPYRRHDEAARALLEESTRTGDERVLDRLLERYPNAAAVADALLALARARLGAGDAPAAVAAVRRLLESHGGGETEAAALATLSRALAATGAAEAARAALDRLARRHADAKFEMDGRGTTGRAFAAAERERLGAPGAGSVVRLEPPFSAAFSTDVDDGSGASFVPVEGASRSLRSVPALVAGARDLVGLDVREGRERFRVTLGGPVHLAAVAEDVLVVAVSEGSGSSLVGLDPSTGAQRWRRRPRGIVSEMEPVEGQMAVLTSDTTRARTHLALVSPTDGKTAWSQDLGPDPHHSLAAGQDDLLLRRLRPDGPSRESIVVRALLDGAPRAEVPLPQRALSLPPRLVDRTLLLLAGRDASDADVIEAWDVAGPTRRWRTPLPGGAQLRPPLLATEEEVLAVDTAATVTRLSRADGRVLGRARLGDVIGLSPGTAPVLSSGRVVALVRTPSGTELAAFDPATGTAQWTATLSAPPPWRASTPWLEHEGDALAVVLPRRSRTNDGVDVRLYRLRDGVLLHSGTEGRASVGLHDGGLVVVSGGRATVYRGPVK